jgi:hypothetical protein
MKLVILSILLLSISSYSLADTRHVKEDCSQIKDDCQYYLCLETQKSCGKKGYLRAFGHKYCQDFKEARNMGLSSQTKKWLVEVRTCLIRKLDEMDKDLTCSEIKKQAFNSHFPCYVETKFCNLRKRDKLKIITMLRKEIKKPAIIKLGINIMRSCRVIRWY